MRRFESILHIELYRDALLNMYLNSNYSDLAQQKLDANEIVRLNYILRRIQED